jgi:hypothetical protein
MIPELRSLYNAAFSDEKYTRFMDDIVGRYQHRPSFHIAETPIFIPAHLRDQLVQASEEVCAVFLSPDFKNLSQGALQPGQVVPGESEHSLFYVIDFGIGQDEQGHIVPQLVEVQGFPSLFCYQHILAQAYKRHFDTIPGHFTHLFNGLTSEAYVALLKQVIIADHHPENVVLLEIEPEKQTTAIDFYATRDLLGIPFVCLTKIEKDGRALYYRNEAGKRIRIERIYNRIIFDDLVARPDLVSQFQLTDDVEVSWAGHPNWFFRISKHSLPLFDSKYVPKAFFLDQLTTLPDDLGNYVLKPLFSFAGMGVNVNPSPADIAKIQDPQHYILQRKINYVPAVQTPDEPAKLEIRMMLIHKEGEAKPRLVTNLSRLSKGIMTGVRYNKDKTWVGGSVCFFEP